MSAAAADERQAQLHSNGAVAAGSSWQLLRAAASLRAYLEPKLRRGYFLHLFCLSEHQLSTLSQRDFESIPPLNQSNARQGEH